MTSRENQELLDHIVDLFAAMHELASASARTLLKLVSSVPALLKPYRDTLTRAQTHASAEWLKISSPEVKSCVKSREPEIKSAENIRF